MQVRLHALNPALHATPQVEPLQVAEPLAGEGQGAHEVPQELTLELEAQVLPQA
jgi:hypothetical protein